MLLSILIIEKQIITNDIGEGKLPVIRLKLMLLRRGIDGTDFVQVLIQEF